MQANTNYSDVWGILSGSQGSTNIYYGELSNNSYRLKAVNFYCKAVHLRSLWRSWYSCGTNIRLFGLITIISRRCFRHLNSSVKSISVYGEINKPYLCFYDWILRLFLELKSFTSCGYRFSNDKCMYKIYI